MVLFPERPRLAQLPYDPLSLLVLQELLEHRARHVAVDLQELAERANGLGPIRRVEPLPEFLGAQERANGLPDPFFLLQDGVSVDSAELEPSLVGERRPGARLGRSPDRVQLAVVRRQS